MLLTVLGAQAGVPRQGRPSSGYLVSDAGTTVLLDCGPGVATALSGLGVRLDAVVVTHLHLDHVHDLIVLAKQLVTERAPAPLLLVPDGAREVFETWQTLFPVPTFPLLDRPFRHAFDVRDHAPVRVGALALSTHPLAHAVAAAGVRVEGPGGTLATPVTPASATACSRWPATPTCCSPRPPSTPRTPAATATCAPPTPPVSPVRPGPGPSRSSTCPTVPTAPPRPAAPPRRRCSPARCTSSGPAGPSPC